MVLIDSGKIKCYNILRRQFVMAKLDDAMRARARETRLRVDDAMKIIEKCVLNGTTISLEYLRPQISDKELFDKLILVIKEATQENINNAAFQNKIFALGTNAKDVIVEIASMIKT
jgi:hypothetical protein